MHWQAQTQRLALGYQQPDNSAHMQTLVTHATRSVHKAVVTDAIHVTQTVHKAVVTHAIHATQSVHKAVVTLAIHAIQSVHKAVVTPAIHATQSVHKAIALLDRLLDCSCRYSCLGVHFTLRSSSISISSSSSASNDSFSISYDLGRLTVSFQQGTSCAQVPTREFKPCD